MGKKKDKGFSAGKRKDSMNFEKSLPDGEKESAEVAEESLSDEEKESTEVAEESLPDGEKEITGTAENFLSDEEKEITEVAEESLSDGEKEITEVAGKSLSDEEKESTESAEESLSNEEAEGPVSFEKSLSMLTRENIGAPEDKKLTAAKKFDPIQLAVVAICLAVCVVSTYLLAQNIYGKYKGSKIYSDVLEIMSGGKDSYIPLLEGEVPVSGTPTLGEVIASGVNVNTSTTSVKDMSKMISGLESLSKINSDVYGWIRIGGVGIDYPVLQTDNNEYYLDHAYTGDNIPNGSIYADFRCGTYVPGNYNTVLYGHNMTDGSMFNGIRYFVDDENFFRDARIYVYTFDGVFIYRAFSAYETTYDSGYIDTYFETPNDYAAFLKELTQRSAIAAGDDVAVGPDKGILTLSTCTNGNRNARYAVHAVLVDYVFK